MKQYKFKLSSIEYDGVIEEIYEDEVISLPTEVSVQVTAPDDSERSEIEEKIIERISYDYGFCISEYASSFSLIKENKSKCNEIKLGEFFASSFKNYSI